MLSRITRILSQPAKQRIRAEAPWEYGFAKYLGRELTPAERAVIRPVEKARKTFRPRPFLVIDPPGGVGAGRVYDEEGARAKGLAGFLDRAYDGSLGRSEFTAEVSGEAVFPWGFGADTPLCGLRQYAGDARQHSGQR